MKTLAISIFASAIAFGFGTHTLAQKNVEVFITQPCQLAWQDIPVTQGHAMNGVPLYVTTLKKKDTRKTFADITPKEWKRLKKRAKKLHACEINVDDDYKLPKQAAPDSEKEAALNGYIHIYMTVPSRPCPECPQPTTTSKR